MLIVNHICFKWKVTAKVDPNHHAWRPYAITVVYVALSIFYKNGALLNLHNDLNTLCFGRISYWKTQEAEMIMKNKVRKYWTVQATELLPTNSILRWSITNSFHPTSSHKKLPYPHPKKATMRMTLKHPLIRTSSYNYCRQLMKSGHELNMHLCYRELAPFLMLYSWFDIIGRLAPHEGMAKRKISILVL